ncbi:MAG: hypothetical protein KGL39_24850 [Patescibacteria group bacterium]|nr:hypothetical protein [Patescibacteria group bacterium]
MKITLTYSIHRIKGVDGRKPMETPRWVATCDEPGWLEGSGKTSDDALASWFRANIRRFPVEAIIANNQIAGRSFTWEKSLWHTETPAVETTETVDGQYLIAQSFMCVPAPFEIAT